MSGRTRRIWMGVGLLAIAGAIALLIAGGLRENVVFFLTPSELQAKGSAIYDRPVRLGGQVVAGSVEWHPESRDLRFTVTDGTTDVPVRSVGAPPAMFQEGMGVVVEGRFVRSGVFESDNVMVKHSNEYRPPHGDEKPEKLYETLIRKEEP